MKKLYAAMTAVFLLTAQARAQSDAAVPGEAPQGPPINWVKSPVTVDLGTTAQVNLEQGFVFADAADTKRLMAAMGNVPDDSEVGLVSPDAKDEDWIMVFEYHPVGYVKDDEKDKIDADALLEGIREGTERANERRKEMGVPGLHVIGWDEKPNYDPATHNFQWAIRAKDDSGNEVVNYNIRLLGRGGYMSVTLVDDPQKLVLSKPKMMRVLEGFSYKKGSSYAEFRSGDKMAEYGLVALIAGGAGVGAAKLGLFAVLGKMLAKGGKVVIVAVIALLAGLKKLFSKFFNRPEPDPQ
jgi:uncharacterized membrane-anchored protein